MIKINKKQLEYLLNGASKDDMRTNLQGIYFDVQNKVAATTNGHILLTCPIVVEVEVENVLYSTDSIKLLIQAIKRLPKYVNEADFEIINGQINVAGIVITLQKVDGIFPDYRAVLPNIEARQRQFTLSREVLENLIAASKQFDKNDKRITFCLSESDRWNKESITVYVGDNECVAMPMGINQYGKKAVAA